MAEIGLTFDEFNKLVLHLSSAEVRPDNVRPGTWYRVKGKGEELDVLPASEVCALQEAYPGVFKAIGLER